MPHIAVNIISYLVMDETVFVNYFKCCFLLCVWPTFLSAESRSVNTAIKPNETVLFVSFFDCDVQIYIETSYFLMKKILASWSIHLIYLSMEGLFICKSVRFKTGAWFGLVFKKIVLVLWLHGNVDAVSTFCYKIQTMNLKYNFLKLFHKNKLLRPWPYYIMLQKFRQYVHLRLIGWEDYVNCRYRLIKTGNFGSKDGRHWPL